MRVLLCSRSSISTVLLASENTVTIIMQAIGKNNILEKKVHVSRPYIAYCF